MSVFDTPQPFLNPILWSPSGHLHPEVKAYVIQLLTKIFPMEKVSSLTMIGSSVGHQYSATSDIDINVMARKGEMFDTWHPIFKAFNDRPNLYPHTLHPINFFFQEYTPGNDWSNSLGAYDIMQDRWAKHPIPFDKIGDPQQKYAREIAYGRMILSMIDTEVSAMEEARIAGRTSEYIARRQGLAVTFKNIEDNRKASYKYHIGTPALQENNILYKMIESSKHHALAKELIATYDIDWRPNV